MHKTVTDPARGPGRPVLVKNDGRGSDAAYKGYGRTAANPPLDFSHSLNRKGVATRLWPHGVLNNKDSSFQQKRILQAIGPRYTSVHWMFIID